MPCKLKKCENRKKAALSGWNEIFHACSKVLQRGNANLQIYYNFFRSVSDFDVPFFSNLLKKDAMSSFSIPCMDCTDVQSSGVNFEFTFCNVCGHFGKHCSHFEVLFCTPCQYASYCQTAGSLLRAVFFEIQPTWASNT